MSYDSANRVTAATWWTTGSDSYAYGPDNLRVMKQEQSGTPVYFYYDPAGHRLGTYTLWSYGGRLYPQMVAGQQQIYFAGRNVSQIQDRLGSMMGGANGVTSRYYPYGEEYTTTAQDTDKFATYYRDQTTALDYARNRYYSSTWGRFLTPDPYRANNGAAGDPGDPGSWNRYAYVQGDPINHIDRRGLFLSAEDCINDPEACEAEDWGNGGAAPTGGGNDSGGAGNPCSIANLNYLLSIGFSPMPNCLGPPPPPPMAALKCSFTGRVVGPLHSAPDLNGTTISGYFIKVDFTYSASGGTGGYIWSNSYQTYNVVGTVTYASGSVSLNQKGTEGPLPYYGKGPSDFFPKGPSVTYYDSPGLGAYSELGSPLLGAAVVFRYGQHVTLSDSAGDTVPCDKVLWQVWEVWQTVGGKTVPSGGAVIFP